MCRELVALIGAILLPISVAGADITVTATNKVAIPGSAYKSDKEEFVGLACLKGATINTGAAESSFSLDQTMSESQASKELGFAIGARARYGVMEASLAADFVTRSTSNAYSVSFIYSARYILPVAKLASPISYTEVGESVRDHYERWNETCGDMFVDEVRKGAKFFASIRVDFDSSSQKKDFQSKFKLEGPMAGINLSLKDASSSFGRNVKVMVSVYQLGGDVSKVTGIFGDSDDARRSYTECTLGTFESCAAVIQSILKYATDTRTGFPSQIAPDVAPGPAVLSYGITHYQSAGIYPKNYPFLSDAVKLARTELSQKFESAYRQHVTATRQLGARLETARRTALLATLAAIKSNIGSILKTSQICYDAPAQCPDAVNNQLTLQTIDESLLLPVSFVTACVAALAADPSQPSRQTVERILRDAGGMLFREVKDEVDCRVYELLIQRRRTLSLRRDNDDGPSLTDLSPVQGLTNVTTLDISNNSVGDLGDLGQLSELTVLTADNNRIDSVRPLENLVHLQVLRVRHNRLADVGVISGLKRLREVDFGQNQIADVTPFAALPELERLDLSGNNIASLAPLKEPFRLKWINIAGNLVPVEDLKAFCGRHPGVAVTLRADAPPEAGCGK